MPHQIALILPKGATVEKVIEILQRRTCLDGKWEGRVASDKVPRVIELRRIVPSSVPSGEPQDLTEGRVFFGTLEHKGVFPMTMSEQDAL
jgi:hypothetical protein